MQKTNPTALSLTDVLLILTIFFSPFRCYVLFSMFGFNISCFRLLFILTVFLFLVSLPLNKKIRFNFSNNIFLLGFLFLSLIFFTLAYSKYLFLGDTLTRVFLKIFGSFFMLFIAIYFMNFRNKIFYIINVYIYSSLIPTFIGYYQLFCFYIKNTTPRMLFADFAVQSKNLYGINYNIYLRPSGTFLEPNYFGIFLGSILMLCFYQAICNLNKVRNWMIFFFVFPVFISTNSFSAFIGFLLTLFLIFFFWIKDNKNKIYLCLASSLFVFFSMILLKFSNVLFEGVYLKFQIRSTQVDSLFGRKTFIKDIFDAAFQNFGLGSGYGGLIQFSGGSISTGHNSFLTVLGEQGFLSLFVLIAFLGAVLKSLFRIKEISELSIVMTSIFFALLSLLIANIGYDSLFSFDSSWCLLAIAFALALNFQKRRPLHNPNRNRI